MANAKISSLTASSRHIQKLITTYEKLVGRFDYERFQTLFNISHDDIDDPGNRISIDYLKEIFVSAYRVTGRSSIGLEFALKWNYQSGEILLRRLGMVEDIYTCFLTNMNITQLISDAIQVSFHPYDDDCILLEFYPRDSSKVSQYQLEYACLLFVIGSSLLLRRYIPSDKSIYKFVQFTHKVEDISLHESFFQLPICHEKERTGVVIKKEWLSTKIYEKPDLVKQIFRDNNLQNEVLKTGGFVPYIRKLVTLLFTYRVPDVDFCCSIINVSKRTLQRRLKEEGTSFRDILDEARKSQATHYLSIGLYSIDEIAFILGYANIQAFYTSFQRWHDMTPRQYLRQLSSTDH